MSVKILNSKNFENEVLNHNGVCLVDFYADWCGPCKMVSPIVDQIAEERTDITIGKINVDQNPALAGKYDIMSIPALIVFKDGKEYARAVGYRPKQDILAMLP